MRIDLMLATEPVAERVKAAWIDRKARKGTGPSDHAPVIIDLDVAPDGDIGPVVPPPSAPRERSQAHHQAPAEPLIAERAPCGRTRGRPPAWLAVLLSVAITARPAARTRPRRPRRSPGRRSTLPAEPVVLTGHGTRSLVGLRDRGAKVVPRLLLLDGDQRQEIKVAAEPEPVRVRSDLVLDRVRRQAAARPRGGCGRRALEHALDGLDRFGPGRPDRASAGVQHLRRTDRGCSLLR